MKVELLAAVARAAREVMALDDDETCNLSSLHHAKADLREALRNLSDACPEVFTPA